VAGASETPRRLSDMRSALIRLVAGAAETIRREAPASGDGSETGGILLGHDLDDTIHVTIAGDPGPKAERRPDGFLRDLAHSRRLADDAYDEDGSVWIGEWHTHPSGPATPSDIDMNTYGQLLSDPELVFTRIVSIIVTACPVHGWSELTLVPWLIDRAGVRGAEFIVTTRGEEDKAVG
jgi:integrative and conjugative element protein (TIGR02256 family)